MAKLVIGTRCVVMSTPDRTIAGLVASSVSAEQVGFGVAGDDGAEHRERVGVEAELEVVRW